MINIEVQKLALRHANATSTNWVISLLNKTVGSCYIPDMDYEQLAKVVQAIEKDIDYRAQLEAGRNERISKMEEIGKWNSAVDAKKKAKKS